MRQYGGNEGKHHIFMHVHTRAHAHIAIMTPRVPISTETALGFTLLRGSC